VAGRSIHPVGSGPKSGHVSTVSRAAVAFILACIHSQPVSMDYLRTLGTAAVSSIVQKSGLNLPFSLGRKLPPLDTLSIWTLYDAIKRVYRTLSTVKPILIPIQDDATPVSVFEFNSQHRHNLLSVAQNAVRRLRVTRHPDILKFMDVVEGDGTIYIMTERVKPLSEELISWGARPVKDRQDWLLWGLHRITVRTQALIIIAR
jgi:SCY1-like protein 1